MVVRWGRFVDIGNVATHSPPRVQPPRMAADKCVTRFEGIKKLFYWTKLVLPTYFSPAIYRCIQPGADPAGLDWMASHLPPPPQPPFRTAHQKYNTWKDMRKYVGPKEIEKTTKLTGDNTFP